MVAGVVKYWSGGREVDVAIKGVLGLMEIFYILTVSVSTSWCNIVL